MTKPLPFNRPLPVKLLFKYSFWTGASITFKTRLLSVSLFSVFSLYLHAATNSVTSPDRRMTLTVKADQTVRYELQRDGKPLLTESTLGLHWDGQADCWGSTTAKTISHDSTWKPVWGKRATVRNQYNAVVVEQIDANGLRFTTEIRVYNDAAAVRYGFAADQTNRSVQITGDQTGWAFAGDGKLWHYRHEQRPGGPFPLSGLKDTVRCPVTIQLNDGPCVAVMEAAIAGISYMDVYSEAGSPHMHAQLEAASVTLPFRTPWRTMLVGDDIGTLIDSSTLASLNPPCAINDPSWIKPGITLWDWRTWAYQASDGFTYGLDMASWRRFIDYAAEVGIPHLLLDAGWYGLENDPASDPTTNRDYLLYQKGDHPELYAKPAPKDWDDSIDIPELIAYAKERNVAVSLYLNDKVTINFDLEQVLKTYSKWGAAGIKYGFMKAGSRQEKVIKTNRIIRWCAENKLLCNFHDGPVPPSGDYRTWPNCTTREFCHAQSDARRSFGPSDFIATAGVNMLTGPIDTNCGMFDLNDAHIKRPKVFKSIPSTIVAECARILVTFSGQDILLDAPEEYAARPDLAQFIADQTQPWIESKTLSCVFPEQLVMMRRNDRHIFIAALTDEQPRTVDVPLDFLEAGSFDAVIFEDAAVTHFQGERETYQSRKAVVTNNDKLTLRLAAGGGACVQLTPRR